MARFEYSVKKIARETLPRLMDNLVFPNLIYKETISGTAAKQGDTVSVRCPVKLEASEFDQTQGVTAQSMQKNTVDVRLDHLATVDMQVDAIEAACDFDSVIRMFIEPAAAALAEKINAEGLALYADIPYTAGKPGTVPADLQAFADASLALDTLKVPAGRRCAVWNPRATSALKQIPAIVNAEKCGTSSALRTGCIGRVYGMENYMSQAVVQHTTRFSGTLSVKSTVDGGFRVTLTAAGSGNLIRGDLLTVDGKTYTVTEAPAVTGSEVTVSVYPEIHAAAKTKVDVMPSHAANLVFHPDAFAFISRPLQAPAGVESYVTAYNGLSLRVVRDYDYKYKREILSMDVLYAFKTMYPELAVRFLG